MGGLDKENRNSIDGGSIEDSQIITYMKNSG